MKFKLLVQITVFIESIFYVCALSSFLGSMAGTTIGHVQTQKRDGTERTHKKDINNLLKSYVNQLKAFVHDDYVDFSGFEHRNKEILDRVVHTVNWVGENMPSSIWGGKLLYLERVFSSFLEGVNLKSRFKECKLWGSDLVREMAQLNIRVLALFGFNDEEADAAYLVKNNSLNYVFEVSKEREGSDFKMSPWMKKLFDSQSQSVKESFKLLKDTNEQTIKIMESKHPVCPEI